MDERNGDISETEVFFNGVSIPKGIWLNPEMSLAEKWLFGLLIKNKKNESPSTAAKKKPAKGT